MTSPTIPPPPDLDEPPPTEPIPEGEIRELVASTAEGLSLGLLAEGYRAR